MLKISLAAIGGYFCWGTPGLDVDNLLECCHLAVLYVMWLSIEGCSRVSFRLVMSMECLFLVKPNHQRYHTWVAEIRLIIGCTMLLSRVCWSLALGLCGLGFPATSGPCHHRLKKRTSATKKWCES